MSKKYYINYGCGFNKNMFIKVRNKEIVDYTNKPRGGYWASPTNAEYGWKEWCESEDFREIKREDAFIFTLSDNANVHTVASRKDYDALPKMKGTVLIDFEKCIEDGIDAIELEFKSREAFEVLRNWDCESIVVLNANVIEPCYELTKKFVEGVYCEELGISDYDGYDDEEYDL